MTKERAKQIAAQWSEGHVCTLREGEAAEYHKLFYDMLCQQEHFRDGTKMVEQDQSPDSGEMMPQWISVKDRLPEKSGDYIVYYSNTANNKPLISMRHFYGEIPGAFLHNKAMTHWMPMPQPPERPLVLKQGKAFKYEVDDPGFDMSCFSKPEEGHHE